MATKEFIPFADACSYLTGGVNVGLFAAAGGAALIDSGNDKDAARTIQRSLEASAVAVQDVLLTHSNADHAGGAAALASRLGAAVHATRIEAAICADPELEAAFLWGGLPPPELRGKFFRAPPVASRILPDRGPAGEGYLGGLEVLPLPGHFFGQVGFRTSSGALFAGDAVFGADSIAKHPIFFVYDVSAFLSSLDLVARCAPVLPGHGDPVDDGATLAAVNRKAVEAVSGALLDACAGPMTVEELLSVMASRFSVGLDWGQYALVGSTLRSYLVYLRELGELAAAFEAGRLLWFRET